MLLMLSLCSSVSPVMKGCTDYMCRRTFLAPSVIQCHHYFRNRLLWKKSIVTRKEKPSIKMSSVSDMFREVGKPFPQVGVGVSVRGQHPQENIAMSLPDFLDKVIYFGVCALFSVLRTGKVQTHEGLPICRICVLNLERDSSNS